MRKKNKKGIAFGIESLKDEIVKQCNKGEGCFNPDGCDHKGPRKCFHAYCNKYKWVIDRAKQYAEKLGVSYEDILANWEEHRTYWSQNYYQESNQPSLEGAVNVLMLDDWLAKLREKFGEDRAQWKFVCPICGRVQSVGEFMEHGIEVNLAFQHCIGRHIKIDLKSGKGCNYTINGFFCHAKTFVVNEKFIPIPVFEMA